MSASSLKFIDSKSVNLFLDRKDLIDFLEKGLKNFSRKFTGEDGGVVQPVRTAVDVKEYGGYDKTFEILILTKHSCYFVLIE